MVQSDLHKNIVATSQVRQKEKSAFSTQIFGPCWLFFLCAERTTVATSVVSSLEGFTASFPLMGALRDLRYLREDEKEPWRAVEEQTHRQKWTTLLSGTWRDPVGEWPEI